MAYIWIQVVVVYDSDEGDSFYTGLSSVNATAGSFTIAPAGSPPDLPKSIKMRYVLGKTGVKPNEHSHKLPCNAPNNSLFVSGLSFTIAWTGASTTFSVQGRIGERRLNRL